MIARSVGLWLAVLLPALLVAGAIVRHQVAQRLAEARRRIVDLEQRQTQHQAALERAEQARAAAEAELRASEERYVLAVRGSQDGLWEWDIASGAVRLSPRWCSMLGLQTDELTQDRQGWLSRVHVQDRAGLEQALQRHLEGTDARLDHELRLLHKDGSVRWVLSRAVAIRRASGTPYRMVGVDTDVTRLKRMEVVLDAVAEGTSGAFGEAFFPAMAKHFARALEVDCAFITECADHPPTRLRTLAIWSAQGLRDNVEYALKGTPCDEVVSQRRTCFHRSDVGRLFPAEAGFESYLGMPIIASDGRVLGHFAFLDRRPRGDDMLVEAIYRIFLARAAAEIERRQALQQAAAVAA